MHPLRHPAPVVIDGEALAPEAVIARLAPYVSEARQARIEAVLDARTYSVVPVLERVHDMGNVNAVMRSAEGLGFAAAHLADLQGDAAEWAAKQQRRVAAETARLTRGAGEAQRQSQGADKWLDLHLWPSAEAVADALKDAGYRLVATHLSADAVPFDALDFSEPTAILLGNERDGLSDALLARADVNAVLPIDGFIQSYNISVAAALALYHARQDRARRLGHHGDLNDADRLALRAQYYVRAARHAEALLRGLR